MNLALILNSHQIWIIIEFSCNAHHILNKFALPQQSTLIAKHGSVGGPNKVPYMDPYMDPDMDPIRIPVGILCRSSQESDMDPIWILDGSLCGSYKDPCMDPCKDF